MTRLKAKNTIQDGKETYAPGALFTCDDPEMTDYLLKADAAELVIEEEPVAPPTILPVQEMNKKIGQCATVEEIETLIKGETRKSVLEAADKKRQRFIKAGA